MTDTRIIVTCSERHTYWIPDAEPAKCADSDHEHQQHEMHVHRDAVILPDGGEVIAVSFDPVDPYARDRRPDYGLYLDRRWAPPWPHAYLDWPDFGVPSDPAATLAGLRAALDRARSSQHVEIGCFGGHGRTGTALACLSVLAGHDPAEAVAWVRTHYCPLAVETPEQREFVEALPR